jgi:aconitate hydratase
VLTVTQMLRKKGVVGKFVEFYGPGLDHLSLADRATIANMAPEYGATCGFFPIDEETINYLRLHRPRRRRAWRWSRPMPRRRACGAPTSPDPVFTDTLELDLGTVEPSLAGPKRPQDRVAARRMRRKALRRIAASSSATRPPRKGRTESVRVPSPARLRARPRRRRDRRHHLLHQHLEPVVLIAAGLVARNARRKGLKASRG